MPDTCVAGDLTLIINEAILPALRADLNATIPDITPSLPGQCGDFTYQYTASK